MRFCMGIFLAALLAPAPLLADEARDQLIVETVLKLENFNYQSASEKVKAAIGRYLARTPGSEEYFQLVEKFRVEAELSALAKLASTCRGQSGQLWPPWLALAKQTNAVSRSLPNRLQPMVTPSASTCKARSVALRDHSRGDRGDP